MTPEQFMDCRLALRALRRVKRWEQYRATRNRQHSIKANREIGNLITDAQLDLPEYRAMMEAKRRVRKQHAIWQKALGRYEHWEGVSGKNLQLCRPEVFTKENKKRLEGVWREKGKMILPTAEYREARAKFIERIGGEG